MTQLSRWKIRTKLTLMVLAFVVVLSSYAAISYNTRQQLQIDGPFFDRIVRTRQLLTDIAPSPLNLNEAELAVQQLETATESGKRNILIRRLGSLRQSYETAYAR